MKKNKNADTIAWVIIAVLILSITLLWIINVLDYNRDISYNYEDETNLYILKSNAENILENLDTSGIKENEKFYIYKDNNLKEYTIFTWEENEKYKYIDKDWNNVDPNEYIDKTYVREFEMKIDILRYDIKPPEIDNLVFHFDATNIDWQQNTTLSDWDEISIWYDSDDENWQQNAVDKSTISSTDWYSSPDYNSDLPTYKEDEINWLPVVNFDWIDQQLWMDTHEDINGNRLYCSEERVYQYEKSFAIVFKTWENIEDTQIVYEQWWAVTWYNFTIEWWDVRAWIHNKGSSSKCEDSTEFQKRDSWHNFKSVNLWEVLPNTVYFVTVIQDSTHIDDDWRYIDDENKLQIYLNWYLVSETDHVDPQEEHIWWWLGNIFHSNVSWKTEKTLNDGDWDKAYFEWWIWELISRNHVLTPNEIRWVQNYFNQKWLWSTKSIEYNIVNTNISKYNNY